MHQNILDKVSLFFQHRNHIKLHRDQFGSTHFYDYDNCEYYIIRETASPDVIKFGFSCNCLESILKNGGQEMLDELYKGLVLPKDQGHPDAQITIAIDASGIQQTQSKYHHHVFLNKYFC